MIVPEEPASPPDPKMTFRHATTQRDLAACHAVIAALRPSLTGVADWVARASQMQGDGYRVLVAWDMSGTALALAGYRLGDNLVYGRYLYVDDLICHAGHRSKGVGSAMLHEVETLARNAQCRKLVLDTAVSNTDAQRFYRRCGLQNMALGFIKSLEH